MTSPRTRPNSFRLSLASALRREDGQVSIPEADVTLLVDWENLKWFSSFAGRLQAAARDPRVKFRYTRNLS